MLHSPYGDCDTYDIGTQHAVVCTSSARVNTIERRMNRLHPSEAGLWVWDGEDFDDGFPNPRQCLLYLASQHYRLGLSPNAA